jgi:uncharacterized integral membrane protein (TIGR00697 family)
VVEGQEQKIYKYFDWVMALVITVLIISNIASSAKIIDWGVSIFGIPLAFDGGTILFPLSYVLGDVLTEVYGFRKARRVIWTGFGMLGLTSLVFFAIQHLPGEVTWQSYAGQDAYNAILGGVSSGGIMLASLTAYLAGSFTNSVILARLKVATRGRFLWMRTIGSTLAGEAVDTAIFVTVATLTGVFTWDIFLTLILTNYIFKVLFEAVLTPVTYQVVNRLKKAEHEDFFDTDTKFKIFAV